MKLIVDSGSTKTDWAFAKSKSDVITACSKGINPVVQDKNEIDGIFSYELMPFIHEKGIEKKEIDSVFFYGAGCTTSKAPVLLSIIKKTFCDASVVVVESDLLGAARSLCGKSKGIAAILGTGANSCYYDGEKILSSTPALGYILGDEGSGAVLGRNFINGILKGWLPKEICENFLLETKMTVADIIDGVYRSKCPNRFLASMSKFIANHIADYCELDDLVVRNFNDFIRLNILPYLQDDSIKCMYGQCCPKVNAVGSVAFYYKSELQRAMKNYGLECGHITKSPLVGLIDYHF